jgi:hypothetical protein
MLIVAISSGSIVAEVLDVCSAGQIFVSRQETARSNGFVVGTER